MNYLLSVVSFVFLLLVNCSWAAEPSLEQLKLFDELLTGNKDQAFEVGKCIFEEMIKNKNMPGFEFVTEEKLSGVAFSVAQYKALTEVVDDTVHLHQYVADSVYEGDEKPISAFMLARYYLTKNQLERAMQYADMAEAHWSASEKDLVYQLRASLAAACGNLAMAEQYMIQAGQCTKNQQFINELPEALATIRNLKNKQKKSCCFLL
jgi:putative sterol carrier protein